MSINLTNYKYLHENPELSYEEFNTTKYLKEVIKEYDLEIHDLSKTGFFCITKNTSENYLLFRTDIDALPITEMTNSNNKSKNEGVMHACGHDIHMSSILDFLEKIMPKVNDLTHNIIFVFQPAEEKYGGGKEIVDHPVIKNLNIKACHAVHVWPDEKINTLITKPGTLLATNRTFKIVFKGKSSHAATPQLANQVLQPAVDFINYTNTILAKKHDPNNPLIINIGTINGGSATNIVISELVLQGTIRSTSDIEIEEVVNLIKSYLKNSEKINNIDITYELLEQPYPTVVNDNKLYNKLKKENWKLLENPSLASEDFGFYKAIAPSIMVFVGTDEGENESLHSNTFLPNPDVINTISNLYIDMVETHEKN